MQQEPEREPDLNETVSTLQKHVTQLTDLLDNVNSLRNQAHSLLVPSTFTRTETEQGFEQINSLRTTITNSGTQDPLKKAHNSFSKSPKNVKTSESRSLNLKRTYVSCFLLSFLPCFTRSRIWDRRPLTPEPESPRPATAAPDLIFPPLSRPALTVSELPSYIREHNKAKFPTKIYIWTHARPDTSQPNKSPLLQDRITLRISIPDVLYAYIKFEVEGADDEDIRMIGNVTKGKLMVETATVFGPRERVRRCACFWYRDRY